MEHQLTQKFALTRNRPSGLLLNTEKVNDLKRVRGLSNDAIARRCGRTTNIIRMTIKNQATGIESQRAIAAVLRVPLSEIAYPDPRRSAATASSIGTAPEN